MDKQDEILAALLRIANALERREMSEAVGWQQINGKWCLGSGKITWGSDTPARRGSGEGRH